MKRALRLVLEVIVVAAFAGAIISTLSFLAAETPQEAAQKGLTKMPATWEAGVYNHGTYYEWYSIKEHPFLFSASIAGIITFGFVITYTKNDT